MSPTAGINSVHTFAAHKAVHKMAIAQGPSISSESSKTRPPFFTPVSMTPPPGALPSELEAEAQATPPDSRSQSPEVSTKGPEGGNLPGDISSADVTASTGSSVSSNLVFSFAGGLPHQTMAVNPFTGLFLPGLPVPPLPSTPTLVALPPNPFPLPILPTSILPSAIPLASPIPSQLASLQAPKFPFPSLCPQFPGPMALQADLQTLTNLQRRISTQLSSMHSSDEEMTDANGSSSCLDMKDEEGSLPAPMSRHRFLIAEPAEYLNRTPEVSLQRALSESENEIEYIDTQDRLSNRVTSSRVLSGQTSSAGGRPLLSSQPLSTAVKFTNTAPLLSLVGGTSRPIHLPGVLPSHSGIILPNLPSTITSPAALTSPTNQYSSVLPLLYSPLTPALTSPHALSNFYLLPTSLALANANPQTVNLSMGQTPFQHLPTRMGVTQGTHLVSTSQSLLSSQLSSSQSSLALSVTLSQSLSSSCPPSISSSLTPSRAMSPLVRTPTGLDDNHVDNEDSDLQQPDARSIVVEDNTDDSVDPESRKRKGDFPVSTSAKMLKLSTSPQTLPLPLIGGIATNQNHPRWSGDTTAELQSEDESVHSRSSSGANLESSSEMLEHGELQAK